MRSYGQIAYEGYCKASNNKSLVSGANLPAWADLSPAIRGAWNLAADAVLAESETETVAPARLIQTESDNCWQTCVAALLGIDPSLLPDQHAIHGERGHYGNELRAYLLKHHDLTLALVEAHAFPAVRPASAFHLITCETVRTSPENDVWHSVIGKDGELWHDPHPSQAGMTKALKWEFLVPFPDSWRKTWRDVPCKCPACLDGNSDKSR